MTRCLSASVALIMSSLLPGCTGVVEDPGGAGADGWRCRDTDTVAVGPSPLRRLTTNEYRNTLRDLFGATLPPLPSMPPDAIAAGAFENEALALGPSDVRIGRWEEAAMNLGAFAVENAEARARTLPCSPGADPAGCGRMFVERFGRRVMRRPLTEHERNRYETYFEDQRAAIDFDAAVQLTIAAMLQSPQFLYRLEMPGEEEREGEGITLTSYEVASRLSYFLWETMPDDTLLDAAERNELRTETQMEMHARRMLADERAKQTMGNFHRQWLHLDRVRGESKLTSVASWWSPAVAAAAAEESERFAREIAFSGGTLTDLLTSPTAYVNPALAPAYGISAPASGTWERVTLPAEERSGILTRIAFLAGFSHAATGSPPLRGNFVLDRFLCEPTPAPPPTADTSVPEPEAGEGPVTNRELFERRTAASTCAGCHIRMNGIGYAFEAYDAAGGHRALDNGLPVNAAGFLSRTDNDGIFDGAMALSSQLAGSGRVHRCVATQWLRYAEGREAGTDETCHVERLERRFIDNGGNIADLMLAIVQSPEFRQRRAAEESP